MTVKLVVLVKHPLLYHLRVLIVEDFSGPLERRFEAQHCNASPAGKIVDLLNG